MKAIGIDPGGSFPEIVLCDMRTGQVSISAKAMS